MPISVTNDDGELIEINQVWEVAGYDDGELCVVRDFGMTHDNVMIDVYADDSALCRQDRSTCDIVPAGDFCSIIHTDVNSFLVLRRSDMPSPVLTNPVEEQVLSVELSGEDVDRVASEVMHRILNHEKQRVPVFSRLDEIGRGDLFKYFLENLRKLENPLTLHQWLDSAVAEDHMQLVDKRSLDNAVQFLLTADGPPPTVLGINRVGTITTHWKQVYEGKADKILATFQTRKGVVDLQVIQPDKEGRYSGTTNTMALTTFLKRFAERFENSVAPGMNMVDDEELEDQ